MDISILSINVDIPANKVWEGEYRSHSVGCLSVGLLIWMCMAQFLSPAFNIFQSNVPLNCVSKEPQGYFLLYSVCEFVTSILFL